MSGLGREIARQAVETGMVGEVVPDWVHKTFVSSGIGSEVIGADVPSSVEAELVSSGVSNG